MWGWGKACSYQLFYCHSLEWERNGRTENVTVVRPATFWFKRERQSNKSTERRGEIEKNGKMKDAVTVLDLKEQISQHPVIQSRSWLMFNKHIKGARSF